MSHQGFLTSQLFFSAVQLGFLASLDGPEACQNLHELSEVDAVIGGVGDEGMHNPIAQRVDCQLGDSEKVLT